MNIEFLKALREEEAYQILRLLPPSGNLLEIGAGAGWQNEIFSSHGFQVSAVELAESQYNRWRNFPIALYDGINLPYADEVFDVVYSSSVLEHVADLPALSREMQRVLKPGGIALHVLPRGRWCLWTLLTHFAGGLRHPRQLLTHSVPLRHGLEGEWYSEFFLFRRGRWKKRLNRLGWNIVYFGTNHLVYSGNSLLHFHLSIKTRKKLALIFGGVCQIILTKKTHD